MGASIPTTAFTMSLACHERPTVGITRQPISRYVGTRPRGRCDHESPVYGIHVHAMTRTLRQQNAAIAICLVHAHGYTGTIMFMRWWALANRYRYRRGRRVPPGRRAGGTAAGSPANGSFCHTLSVSQRA
eukprot:6212887-Pleurochrysis_carterae.AAC.5